MEAPSPRERFVIPICLIGVAGLWLLARPYFGVRHDGILYLGQLYQHLEPHIFQQDLFFAFGSQDQFSLFSRLQTPFFNKWGLETTQFVTLALGHTLLLLACVWLSAPLALASYRIYGLVALAVMPHFYGGMLVFSFGETFVTARTLAEPLALLALACLLYGHRLAAVALGGATALLHPLVALPAFVTGWVWLTTHDKRWVMLAFPALAGASIVGWLGVSPLDQVFHAYDEEWLSAVQHANPFAFPILWSAPAWTQAIGVIGISTWGARLLPSRLADVVRAAAFSASLLLLVSVLATHFAENILLTQLQLWRGMWLPHLLLLLTLPAMLIEIFRQGRHYEPAAISLAATIVALTSWWASGLAVAAWACAMVLLGRSRPPGLTERGWALLRMASWAALITLSLLVLFQSLGTLQTQGVKVDLTVILWAAATSPLLVAVLAWTIVATITRLSDPRLVGTFVSALLLVLGYTLWDQRGPLQREAEVRPPSPHPFTQMTAPTSQIYWPDSLALTWAMLGRASYFTDQQGAGLLFNRRTAMEFERRRRVVAPLSLQREICMMFAAVSSQDNGLEDCIPDIELVEDICRAEGGPDHLVFPFALSRGAISSWDAPPKDNKVITFHLHDCAKLR